MKFKFDHKGRDYILTMDQLLKKHDDLSRLKNPRLFLNLQDSKKKDLYAGDSVRVRVQEEKFERRRKVQEEKWDDGVIVFMSTDLAEGCTEKDLIKDPHSFISYGLASYTIKFDGYSIPLSGFKIKDVTKIS